jgi:hypothetical protein
MEVLRLLFYFWIQLAQSKRGFLGTPGITVFPDGHGVARSSDWIMYAVEAEFIDSVVAQFAPCTQRIAFFLSPCLSFCSGQPPKWVPS